MTELRSRKLAAAAAAMIFAGTAAPAFSQTAQANLGVSATVTNNCTVSTDPVAFGDVDVTTGAEVLGTGAVNLTCTNGATWSAAADAGDGDGATILARSMTSGANELAYQLYTEPTRTDVWGDGVDGETIDGTGTGLEQEIPIYARVLAGQGTAAAGVYADTVVVTVTYEGED